MVPVVAEVIDILDAVCEREAKVPQNGLLIENLMIVLGIGSLRRNARLQ
jgi:hypothetical protein